MIRVGVDAWNLPGDRRGIGRYLREILRVWWERNRSQIEVTLIVPEWQTWLVRNRYLREVGDRPYRVVSRRWHARAPLDLLWFPFNGCSWERFSLPAVATLHDASNFVVPQYAPQTQRILRAAERRCSILITDSSFQQRELARELDISPTRIVPIPLGTNPPLSPQPVALDVDALAPFVLYVGTPERRKGFDVLVAAMRQIAEQRPDFTLVVTANLDEWRSMSEGVRVSELGHVDDATLAALYRRSCVLAFPSRYEGFGLPVLEAMSYGAPVVASNASSIPEAGGDAACYVPPDDPKALADAILHVAGDDTYAASLRDRGLRRAAVMTWERTAEQTLATLELALHAR